MIVASAAEFGKAIRGRRKELGYTQAFLSEYSGFSVSFLSELENGKKTIQLEKALRLANMLGLDCKIVARG